MDFCQIDLSVVEDNFRRCALATEDVFLDELRDLG
jgi:hypothetical protein